MASKFVQTYRVHTVQIDSFSPSSVGSAPPYLKPQATVETRGKPLNNPRLVLKTERVKNHLLIERQVFWVEQGHSEL